MLAAKVDLDLYSGEIACASLQCLWKQNLKDICISRNTCTILFSMKKYTSSVSKAKQ